MAATKHRRDVGASCGALIGQQVGTLKARIQCAAYLMGNIGTSCARFVNPSKGDADMKLKPTSFNPSWGGRGIIASLFLACVFISGNAAAQSNVCENSLDPSLTGEDPHATVNSQCEEDGHAIFTGLSSPGCGVCLPRIPECNDQIHYRIPNNPHNFCGPEEQCERGGGIRDGNQNCAETECAEGFADFNEETELECLAECPSGEFGVTRQRVSSIGGAFSRTCVNAFACNDSFFGIANAASGLCETEANCSENQIRTATNTCVPREPGNCPDDQEFTAASDDPADGGICTQCMEHGVSTGGATCTCSEGFVLIGMECQERTSCNDNQEFNEAENSCPPRVRTDCPDGEEFRPARTPAEGGTCVACETNEVSTNGDACECPDMGHTVVNGECQVNIDPASCTADQIVDAAANECTCNDMHFETRAGACVDFLECTLPEILDRTRNECACPREGHTVIGTVINGERVEECQVNVDPASCPAGQIVNRAENACVACGGANQTPNGGRTECVCESGYRDFSAPGSVLNCQPVNCGQNQIRETDGRCRDLTIRDCGPTQTLANGVCGDCGQNQTRSTANSAMCVCIDRHENIGTETELNCVFECSEGNERIGASCLAICAEGETRNEEGVCTAPPMQSSGGGDSDDGYDGYAALVAAPAVLIGGYWLLGGLHYIDPAYDFGYSGENGDLEWRGNAGFNLRHGGLRSYASAVQSNGDAVSYESGISYEKDYLALNYDATESGGDYAYDLAAQIKAEFGLWTISPTAAAEAQYREGEFNLDSSAGVEAAWTSHRWIVSGQSSFAGNTSVDLKIRF